MAEITRRKFMRGLGISAFAMGSIFPKHIDYSGDSQLEQDWEEAIKGDRLKQEISDLMREHSYTMSYTIEITPENIIHAQLPLRVMEKMKGDLIRLPNIKGRGHTHYNSDFLFS